MLSDSIHATFTYGGEFYRDVQDGAAASGDREGVPDADSNFYGLFPQAEIPIAEPFGVLPGDLLIIPGLRFDPYTSYSEVEDSNTDHAVPPPPGPSYMPEAWLQLVHS